MIRADKIKTSLLGGVGFRQSPITAYAIVDAANQVSQSGLFYQDASTLVTVKNIKDAQQVISIADVDFNTYLQQLQEGAIIEVCRKVTASQADFIQEVNLYPYEKSFKNTITTRGKFVGFVFDPKRKAGILGRINFLEVCFNEAVTFDIHLFNSNKPNAPIQTQSVDAIANEAVVIPMDWYIADDVSHKGGSFYVGYFEDDLGTAKAVKKDYDLAQLQVNTKCFYVRPISLDHTGTAIDVESVINESDTFGLNMGIGIYNDYTEIIIRNKNIFWSAIQLQMAEKVLSVLRTSTRLNGNNRTINVPIDDVNFDLFGNDKLKIQGIVTKLQREIESVIKMLFYVPRIRRRTLS